MFLDKAGEIKNNKNRSFLSYNIIIQFKFTILWIEDLHVISKL